MFTIALLGFDVLCCGLGVIPTELGALAELASMFVSDNKLIGNIPTELGDLTKLTKLDLNGNSLSGKCVCWL